MRRLVIPVLGLTLLAGCGQAPNQATGPNPSTPGGTVPTSSGSPPNSTPAATVTIRGEVAEGVEAGCMLLRTADGPGYLLLGGDRSLIVAGERLEVVGNPEPDLFTTCQQGIPFTVITVRRI